MKAYERLLKYAEIDTQSSEDAQGTPSTPGQLRLCALLAEEMRAIGLQKVYEDGRGYVYGYLPAAATSKHVMSSGSGRPVMTTAVFFANSWSEYSPIPLPSR